MATKSEKVKAGVFLVSAIFILITLLVFVGYIQLREQGDKFYSTFSEVRQLSEGAPVKYKGVEVGEVIAVSVPDEPTGDIRVTYRVQEPRLMTENIRAMLDFLNPLAGSQYINLKPRGTAPPAEAEHLSAGSEVPSAPSQVQTTFQDITTALEDINTLLDKNKEEISKLVATSNQMLNDFRQVLFVEDVTKEELPEGSLVRLLHSTSETVDELKETSRSLKKIVKDTGPHISSTAETFDQTVSEMQELFERERVNAFLRQTKDIADKSEQLTQTMQHLTNNIDRTLQENRPAIRNTLKQLETTSRNLKRLTSRLQNTTFPLLPTNRPPKRKIPEEQGGP